ncbi:MAG: hypothetical protein QM778_02550 [Myxococcales bacterium]
MSSFRLAPTLLLCLSLAVPGSAWAQDEDPEAGDVGATEEPAKPAPNTWGVSGSASGSTSEGTSTSGSEWETAGGAIKREEASSESDHEAVVGKVGIGLLGLAEVPVGTFRGDTRTVDSVLTAPILGMRYWIGERFGVEAGLGFMFRGGSIKDSRGGPEGNVSSRAFALNLGLPIALVWGKHYNVIAIPYVGMGFSKATDPRGDAATANDVFGKGLLFEAGLRAGVEVQLGAIGLEGFALQLTGGLRLRIEKTSANVPIPSDDQNTPPSSYDLDSTSVVFATSQGSTLGSSIAGCIAALYYF